MVASMLGAGEGGSQNSNLNLCPLLLSPVSFFL